MRIQTNTAANSALGYMRVNNQATERSIQKLSSGFRINRAGDDAAGLAIANKLRADVRGLGQAQKNAAQGTAMLQIMDGAAQTVSSILDRMKELATQANSANVGDQAQKLDDEFQALVGEVGRIVDTTKYQGTTLLDGKMGSKVDTDVATSTLLASAKSVVGAKLSGAAADTYTFTDDGAGKITITNSAGDLTQTIDGAAAGKQLNFDKLGVSITLGAGYADGDAAGDLVVTAGTGKAAFQVSSSGSYTAGGKDLIEISGIDLTTATLGLDTLDLKTTPADALKAIDGAIDKANDALGTLGAAQSRMDFASANVATMLQNTQAAESTIRDADMAEEMTKFTKNNILQQAAQSMLSQANQGTQGILQLLRG
jgi:flagellin